MEEKRGKRRVPKLMAMSTSVFLYAGLLMAWPGPADAFGRGGGGPSLAQTMTQLTERLDLSADQEAAIRPIIEDDMEQRQALGEKLRGQGRQSMGSLRSETEEMQESTEVRLEEILTEEQMGEYRKMKQEQREQRRGRRGGRF